MFEPLRRCRGMILAATIAALVAPVMATSGPGATAPRDLARRLADAQADPPQARAMMKTGRDVAAVCANCHGDGGNSVKPDVPNLAGQHPAYLLEQMRQFADGTRHFAFMEGMIRAMTDDEKVAAVMYYASQAVDRRPVADAGLAARGEVIYEKNCFRCHGADGHGTATFARLAGQQPVYLHRTLDGYRHRTGVRVNPLMAANTRLLTEADIQALVAFISGMP